MRAISRFLLLALAYALLLSPFYELAWIDWLLRFWGQAIIIYLPAQHA